MDPADNNPHTFVEDKKNLNRRKQLIKKELLSTVKNSNIFLIDDFNFF